MILHLANIISTSLEKSCRKHVAERRHHVMSRNSETTAPSWQINLDQTLTGIVSLLMKCTLTLSQGMMSFDMVKYVLPSPATSPLILVTINMLTTKKFLNYGHIFWMEQREFAK